MRVFLFIIQIKAHHAARKNLARVGWYTGSVA